MKKTMITFAFLSLLLTASRVPWGWGAPAAENYDWSDKLLRGVVNIATSPIEIACSIHTTTEEKNLVIGWTLGLAKGFADGLIRFGAGVVDLVTFPFDFPEEDKAPLLDPEFVWQKPGPELI